MAEHSAIVKGSQNPDRKMLRRISNSDQEVSVDRSPSKSGKSPERLVHQATSELRIQNNDGVGDNNCIETECKRLSKYPDYCRTITIRGLTIFTARRVCIPRTMPWQDVCLSVCLSVRTSVCLSHAGIESKRLFK